MRQKQAEGTSVPIRSQQIGPTQTIPWLTLTTAFAKKEAEPAGGKK